MLRISVTSIAIAVLLAGQPVAAKNEGNGEGHGGGNSGGHGNGGGGRDGGGSQGNGHGGDKGNGGGGDRGGNSGANGNNSGGGEKGGRGGQDGGGSRGGGGEQGGSGGKGGGSAEGRGSRGSSTSGGSVGGASNPNAGSAARGGADTNVGGRNAQEARSASPQVAPSTRASEAVATASLTTRESMNQVNLPSSLIPRLESSRADREDLLDVRAMRAGVSGQIVELCRTSIAAAAIPYGAIRVDAAGAGRTSRLARGGLMAPLQVRVVYARANARQVRQSRVACQLNSAGAVVALR